MLPRFRSMFILGAVLALIAGAALVLYARWTEPIMEAAAAIHRQDAERAVGAYAVSARRFGDIAVSQRVMPDELSLVAHNRLALLYRLGQYDELIEKAAEAPPTAAPHFWTGCAMFRKAEREKKAEAQIEWVGRAADEFKLALTAAPDDWDTKYQLRAHLPPRHGDAALGEEGDQSERAVVTDATAASATAAATTAARREEGRLTDALPSPGDRRLAAGASGDRAFLDRALRLQALQPAA